MSKKRPRSYIKKSEYNESIDEIRESSSRELSPEELEVENELDNDFATETKRQFEEMVSFGDDSKIDFGNGLTDSTGFNDDYEEDDS